MKARVVRAILMRAAAIGLVCVSLLWGAPLAGATHWTGTGTLGPLVGFSGEINRFTFTLNSSAAEAIEVYQVQMVACWHTGGSGSDIKPDDGTSVTVPALGSVPFTGDVNVPPLADGLCHTAVVVKGKGAGDATIGYADYHFDVNYSTRPPLTVSVTATPKWGAPPLVVQLEASAAGGKAPYQYAWQFDDGASGTGTNVAHTYALVGRYVPAVTATDADGRRAVASTWVWAFSGLAVNASADPEQGDVPLNVSFRAVVVGQTGAVRFNWSFSDGSNATGANVTHRYLSPGNFSARVEAADDVGGTANASVSVRVDPNVIVSITGFSQFGRAPYNITAQAVVLGLEEPLSYHWVFGDGAILAGRNVTHTFAAPGQYAVVLHVTNPATGRMYTAAQTVVVDTPPPAGRPQPGPGAEVAIAAAIVAAIVCVRVRTSRQR